MATKLNITDLSPAGGRAGHTEHCNAKPASTAGLYLHFHRIGFHEAVPKTTLASTKSQWPVLDLTNPQPCSRYLDAGSGQKAMTDDMDSTSGSCIEDIGLSGNHSAGSRNNLHGSNMPQSLVAKPGHTYKDTSPMERFIAETYGTHQSKAAAKKPHT